MNILGFLKVKKSKFERYLDSLVSLEDKLEFAAEETAKKVKRMEEQTADLKYRKKKFDETLSTLEAQVKATEKGLAAKKKEGKTAEDLTYDIQAYIQTKKTFDFVKGQGVTFDKNISAAESNLAGVYAKEAALKCKKEALMTQIKMLRVSKETFKDMGDITFVTDDFGDIEELLKDETMKFEAQQEVAEIKQSAQVKVSTDDVSIQDVYESLA